jgi:thiosulfate dehydrogenase (quinone) large subunit
MRMPTRATRGAQPEIVRSWQRQPWIMRILRAFLGATFLYAGVQKLTDPNFWHAGTPDYIGAQIEAFGRGTPLHPLLAIAAHAPILVGVVVALVEVAAGLGTLLGIAPASFAGLGLGISLTLFLSATWHVHPYFLGSDSIYAVAWGAYLAGILEARARARNAAAQRRGSRPGRPDFPVSRSVEGPAIRRREFLRGATVAAGTVVLGGLSFFGEGSERVAADPPPSPSPSVTGPSPRPSSTGAGHHGSPPPTPEGTPIASLNKVSVGEAVDFTDPAAGPAVLVRLGQDRVAAYSRICTHAGCLVDFDPSSRTLLCPCHGAEFDPAHGAEVVTGPAPTPLPKVPVVIDHATGQVLATS